MKPAVRLHLSFVGFVLVACLNAQGTASKPIVRTDDDQLRPPVTKADIEVVRRARQILDSPAKWNRADNRVCPKKVQRFSLYCALERSIDEVSGNFEHRGAAMQEARFVIEEIAPSLNPFTEPAPASSEGLSGEGANPLRSEA